MVTFQYLLPHRTLLVPYENLALHLKPPHSCVHLCISKLNESSDLYTGVLREDRARHTLSYHEAYKIMNVLDKVHVYLICSKFQDLSFGLKLNSI